MFWSLTHWHSPWFSPVGPSPRHPVKAVAAEVQRTAGRAAMLRACGLRSLTESYIIIYNIIYNYTRCNSASTAKVLLSGDTQWHHAAMLFAVCCSKRFACSSAKTGADRVEQGDPRSLASLKGSMFDGMMLHMYYIITKCTNSYNICYTFHQASAFNKTCHASLNILNLLFRVTLDHFRSTCDSLSFPIAPQWSCPLCFVFQALVALWCTVRSQARKYAPNESNSPNRCRVYSILRLSQKKRPDANFEMSQLQTTLALQLRPESAPLTATY